MRARFGKVRAAAWAALLWTMHRSEDLAVALARFAGRRRRRPEPPPTPAERPAHADERTARRMAEAEHGGVSSAESAARWRRGENPGGLHHKAVRHEGPEHPRPNLEEPQERKERAQGGENHLPATRRGG